MFRARVSKCLCMIFLLFFFLLLLLWSFAIFDIYYYCCFTLARLAALLSLSLSPSCNTSDSDPERENIEMEHKYWHWHWFDTFVMMHTHVCSVCRIVGNNTIPDLSLFLVTFTHSFVCYVNGIQWTNRINLQKEATNSIRQMLLLVLLLRAFDSAAKLLL